MRFIIALTTLTLGALFVLFSVAQVTFLSAPKVITYEAQLGEDTSLVVIDDAVLSEVKGQATVVVSGQKPAVAFGNDLDVNAWVAPFDRSVASLDSAEQTFTFATRDADETAAKEYAASRGTDPSEQNFVPAVSPSDLWLGQSAGSAAQSEESESENSARETAKLAVSLSEGQSVLVSVDSASKDPSLSVQWVQSRNLPLVGPFLLVGGILVLLGGLLYLLAVDHDRRGLGPRRGRKGLFLGIRDDLSKRRQEARDKKSSAATPTSFVAVALLTSFALSGCSSQYWPQLGESESASIEESDLQSAQNIAPVPVNESQIASIVGNISELTAFADQNLDASVLPLRFTADALKERETNYTIRKSVTDYDVVMPGISDELLGYQLVQSTEGWPRTMLVVVDSATAAEQASPDEPAAEGDTPESPSLALVMTQQTPHDNYLISRSIVLRGNTQMPEAAPAEVGTALIADDLGTLVLQPAQVGPAYAAVLSGGTGVPEAAYFNLEGDTLIGRSGASWVNQASAAASSAGQDITYSVSAAQGTTPITGLTTGVGGALVATTVLETRTEQASANGTYRPTMSASASALSGITGRQNTIVTVVQHQLLFFVPSLDSKEQIQLLGFSSDLISASNG